MPAAQLRPKEPTHDTLCAEGYRDTIREKLDTVSALAGSLDGASDPYANDARRFIVVASNALEDVRRYLWSVADRHVDRMAAAEGLIRGIADERAAQAQAETFPGNGVAGLNAVAYGARAKVRNDAAAQVTRELLAVPAVAAKAEELSTAAVGAMKNLADYQAASNDDFYGPRAISSMAGKYDIGRVQQIGSLENQLRSEEPRAWLDRYKRMLARGEDEKLDLLDEALAPLIRDLLETPPAKVASRFQSLSSRIDAPTIAREIGWELRNLMTARRRANEPPSLGVLQQSIAVLGAVFYELLGTFAPLMSGPAFSRRFLGNANPSDAVDPWGVEPDWISRRLSPAGSPPPGWSPVITKTALGAVVRQPKG